jgi:Flp pilus assembly protein TadG
MTPRLSRCHPTFARFLRDEDGQIAVFTLILFFLMVAFSGMAVDMMRHENARTDLQQTLDRAILAAASMKQVRDPDVVVEDYFNKAGMSDYLDTVDFKSDLDSSEVFVTAFVPVQTFFMKLLNVDSLDAGALGKAEEGVSNIEISLVLDISGSMRFGNQIGKLRVAAKSFFNQILTTDAKKTTSINVVPYAGHVNVGPFLFNEFGGIRTHDNSSCLELPAGDYSTAGKPTSGLAQVPHFMQWVIDKATMDWGWCPKDNSAIIVAQNDKAKLDTFIDNIRLHDGTNTQTGMKYGLMLLNPDMQSTFKKLADNSVIANDFGNRPMPWSTSVGADVQKYLIVMTDGNITEQRRPKNTGFVDKDADTTDNESISGYADPDKVDGTDFDFWNATVELRKQLAGSGENDNASNQLHNAATGVARFSAQCNLAKSNGVIVFSIAFGLGTSAADNATRDQMRNCASSSSYYYNVPSSDDGSAINGAFSSIALTIKQLRLTQ